ncbi:MAG: glycosyltransferase family 4 protein [Candidatus Omnitrophica bacterium]|nr:glycosyltransferase family 4 protein [Candidatus Omnitrophota bacterium]
MVNEEKINLLYVITKLELGGAQKQLLSLVRGLNKEQFRVFLFTGQNGLLVEDFLSITGLNLRRCPFLERAIHLLKDLLVLIDLFLFIKKNNIKIIHTHSSKAGILGRLAAKLAGVKIIIHTVHGWSFHDYQPIFLKGLFISLERFVAMFTDRLIVVSVYDQLKGLKNHIGDQAKYSLIHYGIDYTEFNLTNSSIRSELGLNKNDLVVGMVACFKPQKCPQDFIKLACLINRDMPEVKFVLVGDGVLRKRVEELIAASNLEKNIILLGWRRDIPEILAAFDVFVLTSLWEGLPITLLEAMAKAKAIIATDTGGVREIIEEGKTGFLVQPHAMDELAHKLAGLLKDSALKVRIGNSAKESLKYDFRADKMIDNTQALYNSLMKVTL